MLFTKCCWVDQMKDEVGRACSVHGADEKCVQNRLKDHLGRDHSADLDVDGRILLKWVLRKRGSRMWKRFIQYFTN